MTNSDKRFILDAHHTIWAGNSCWLWNSRTDTLICCDATPSHDHGLGFCETFCRLQRKRCRNKAKTLTRIFKKHPSLVHILMLVA